MPVSLVAVAVLLTLFVPGYLFQAAVREYSSILAADRDIFAVAQAVALSGGFIVFGFFVVNLLDACEVWNAGKIRDELLQSPTTATGLNMAQSLSLLGLLILPILLGRAFGAANARSRKSVPGEAPEPGSVPRWRRVPKWVWRMVTSPIRALFRFFFRPSPMEAEIRRICAEKAPVYVRIVRQGQEDAIGLLDAASQEASRSALGRGVALAARWAPGAGGWERLPGCHVSVVEMIDIIDWRSGNGEEIPDWLRHVPR